MSASDKKHFVVKCSTCFVLISALLSLLAYSKLKTSTEESKMFDDLNKNEMEREMSPEGTDTSHGRYKRQIDLECSDNYTVNAEGGSLNSPDYPMQYSNNLDCQWRLISSTESNIILKFTDLSIEKTDDCEYDFVAVYDAGYTLVRKLCGDLKDEILATNSTTVTIYFHSDPTFTERGFAVQYFPETKSNCQMILKENQGVITSPQYPDNYPDGTDCLTQIVVDPDALILLKFDVLDLEYDANCTYDYVAVYDGTTVDAPLLGHFCSNAENATVTSTNNTLLVHFHSDHLLNYNGFNATYSSVFPEKGQVGACKWVKDEKDGTVASPNYPYNYGRNSKCIVVVQAPKNFVISVFIDDILLEVNDNCSYDRLEIWDGLNKESPLLGSFCGKLNEETNVTSTGSILRFVFISDSFAEFKGFHLKYWIRKKEGREGDVVGAHNKVAVKPSIKDIPFSTHVFNEFPQNSTAVLGESHVMPCKPRISTAKIRWLKDGQFLGGPKPLPGISLMANGTILWMHSMSEDLKGVYTCAAVTLDGVSYSVQAEIDVKKQPRNCSIYFKHRPANMTIPEGDSGFVRCSVSRSKAEISWMRNGIQIPSSGKHHQQSTNGHLILEKADPNMSGVYTCVAENKTFGCVRHSSAFISIPQRINVKNVCGRPITGKPNIAKPQILREKIIGGNNTEKGAYPWQVMLFDTTRRGFCGGSLLNERWVLTAAHCLYIPKRTQLIDKTKVTIKLGKHNQYVVEPEEVATGIERFIIHPAYVKRTYDNDIALIQLQDSIPFTNYISPVCLGDKEFIRDMFFEKSLRMGTVTGWGKLTEKGPRPQYLQELRVPVVDWETCHQSTKYHVTKNMFCAGYAQEIIGDACKGDSGGPFIMEQDRIWYLVGIVSWGDGCGRAGQYGFYTKVDNYHTWIKGIIN